MKRRYPCVWESNIPPLPTLSPEISDNIDPQYSAVLSDLMASFANSKSKAHHKKVFDEFAEKYLALPEFWKHRARLDHPNRVASRCLAQFYYVYFADNNKNLHNFDKCGPIIWRDTDDYSKLNITNLMEYQDKARYLLDYPHKRLKQIFDFYEAYGDTVLTQKEYSKYKTALSHQEEIAAAQNVEEIFQCYVKINDDRTAIQNIEILLSRNPCNKWLWHSYMDYVKVRHPQAYLDILHRYTRLFLSDMEMKNQYMREKPRIEKYKNMKSLSYFLFKDEKPYNLTSAREKMIAKSFKKVHRQNFSLPMPLIRYILKNSTPKLLNALFATCKHMFLLSPTPICCNITYAPTRGILNCIHGQSLRLSRPAPSTAKKLFLTKTLTIDAPHSSTVLSQLISRISKCHFWLLDVIGQSVAWKDLYFLLKAGTVQKFVFIDGKIIGPNQQLISIENVIEVLPSAHTVMLNSAAFTKNTFAKLAALERKTRFKFFQIGKLDCSFKFKDFENFVKAQIQPKGEIVLRMEPSTNFEAITNVKQQIVSMLDAWIPEDTKPKITVA